MISSFSVLLYAGVAWNIIGKYKIHAFSHKFSLYFCVLAASATGISEDGGKSIEVFLAMVV